MLIKQNVCNLIECVNCRDAEKAQQSWMRYLRMDNSRIVDIFVGQLKSTLRCTHCQHSSVTFDPFWDLSLPVPQKTGQLRLSQCLDSFTKEETLDGDEKPVSGLNVFLFACYIFSFLDLFQVQGTSEMYEIIQYTEVSQNISNSYPFSCLNKIFSKFFSNVFFNLIKFRFETLFTNGTVSR